MKRKRRYRSRDEIQSILEEFRTSGLSQTAFAKRIDVSGSVLGRWIKRQQAEESEAPPQPTPSFVPVEVTSRVIVDPVESRFEVVLSTGRVVRVNPGFNEEALGRLVSVLEQC